MDVSIALVMDMFIKLNWMIISQWNVDQIIIFVTSTPSVQFGSVQSLSRVQLFAIPWTIACQAPLSMEFSRQEYWSQLPFLSPSTGMGMYFRH